VLGLGDGGRSGTVFIEDFDEGLVRSFGGQLIDFVIGGEHCQEYVLIEDSVQGPNQYRGAIPIVFGVAQDAYQADLLPRIHVSRSAVSAAGARRESGGYEYRVPAQASQTVRAWNGVTGPSLVEIKLRPEPHDITYDVTIKVPSGHGGGVRGANRLLRRIGAVLSDQGAIEVKDSEGHLRVYPYLRENLQDISEVLEVSERVSGWTLSGRVMGELDFNDPYQTKTCLGVAVSVTSLGVPMDLALSVRRR